MNHISIFMLSSRISQFHPTFFHNSKFPGNYTSWFSIVYKPLLYIWVHCHTTKPIKKASFGTRLQKRELRIRESHASTPTQYSTNHPCHSHYLIPSIPCTTYYVLLKIWLHLFERPDTISQTLCPSHHSILLMCTWLHMAIHASIVPLN